MPVSAVLTGAIVAALVALSAPITETAAPTMTAPLGSTTVTRSVPAVGACANARGANEVKNSTTRSVAEK